MEYIEFNGVRVPVPPEVVSEGREAVQAWSDAETARRATAAAPTPTPAKGKE